MYTGEKDKKPFDATNNFTIFGDWDAAINDIEDDFGIEAAHEFYKAIAAFSMYGIRPSFDTPERKCFKSAWKLLEKQIENSIARRKKSFDREALTDKQSAIIAEIVARPNDSDAAIASDLGVDRTTVWRTRTADKFQQIIADGIAGRERQEVSADTNDQDMTYRQNENEERMLIDDDETELPF